MKNINLNNITKNYKDRQLFNDFSCQFDAGKIHVVMGKSGIGKTTLLNVLANLVDFQGTTNVENVSYVFQDARLIETLTVYKNLELVLKNIEKDKAKRRETIEKYLEIAEILQLKGKFPKELSGGEAQRVAIVRAFIYPADVILLDEPFQMLDVGLKKRLLNTIANMFEIEKDKTVIFVSHDIFDALSIADEIWLLEGSPIEISHMATITEERVKRQELVDYADLKQKILKAFM